MQNQSEGYFFFLTCSRYVRLILSSYAVKSFRGLELGIEIIFVQCLFSALEVIFEKNSDYNSLANCTLPYNF